MPSDLPLHHGEAADFTRILGFFRSAGFSPEQICAALQIESLAALPTVRIDGLGVEERCTAELGLLVRLFLLGLPVSGPEVRGIIGPSTLRAFQALDLLRASGPDPVYSAPVCLYPVEDLLIASDLIFSHGATPSSAASELVYPAITRQTGQFLRVIGRGPTGAALDLCTGSGAAALLLSRTAAQTVAIDITARSAHFARFNRLLNGAENVEVLQGNLYEPVAGRDFDRIVAHPPYAPAMENPLVWRDGGDTGEAVLREIIRGLPRYLRPGGSFYGIALGMETREQSFGERLREWLGEAEGEFDLLFAQEEEWSPRRLALDLVARGGSSDLAAWERHFQRLGMRRAVRGALALHRRAPGPSPLSVRTHLSPVTDGADLEWALRWHRWMERPEAAAEAAELRPQLSPHLRLQVTHTVQADALVPAAFLLETERPFRAGTKVEGWLVALIAWLDGSRTVSEVYRLSQAAGVVPDGISPADFTSMILHLIARGYLRADGPSWTN